MCVLKRQKEGMIQTDPGVSSAVKEENVTSDFVQSPHQARENKVTVCVHACVHACVCVLTCRQTVLVPTQFDLIP